MTTNKQSIIFLDIETCASNDKPELSTIKVPGNYSKPETILAYQTEHQDEEWRKQALDSLTGQILCLCAAVNDQEPVVFDGKEEDILGRFEEWLLKQPSIVHFVGHNIKDFDSLWIFRKSLKYGRRTLVNYFNGTRRDMIFDTMTALDGFSWKTMVSLDKAAKLIGIQGKNGIKGSDVHGMWQRDELQAITDYCSEDVKIVRRLYYALKGE